MKVRIDIEPALLRNVRCGKLDFRVDGGQRLLVLLLEFPRPLAIHVQASVHCEGVEQHAIHTRKRHVPHAASD